MALERREARVHAHFRDARAYRRIALFGHVGLLEAYFDGDVDLDGSLARALAAGMAARAEEPKLLVRLANRWHEFWHSNASWARAKHNAEFHYALGPEFYRYWLDDPLMLYTCAYWKEGTRTLEEAQRNKLDHVGKKVLLKPGDDVVDVGSGFGGFPALCRRALRREGDRVQHHALQVEHARAQIERRRLRNTVSLEADFRSMDRQYDKVVSIGCLEHAGRDGLVDLIPRARARAQARRACLIHFIGHVGTSRPITSSASTSSPAAGSRALPMSSWRWKRPASRCWTSKICGATTRSRSMRGRALRPQLGQDRALDPQRFDERFPAHLGRVPLRLRRDVPLERGTHASLPGGVLQGQRLDDGLPDDARASLRT